MTEFLRGVGRLALDGAPTFGWSRCTADHIHASLYRRMIPETFYDAGFIILRDPASRMRSEFRMVAQTRRRSRNPLNLALRLLARDRRTYAVRFYGIHLNMDIDTWLRLSLFLHRFVPYRRNNHFRRQSEFWHAGLKPFFFEDGLDKVSEWVCATFDLPATPMPHKMPCQDGARVEVPDFSAASKALIRRRFDADYGLIGELRRREGEAGPPSPRVAASRAAPLASAALPV